MVELQKEIMNYIFEICGNVNNVCLYTRYSKSYLYKVKRGHIVLSYNQCLEMVKIYTVLKRRQEETIKIIKLMK